MRLRMTTHCADQISARKSELDTDSKLKKAEEISQRLSCPALAKLQRPKAGDSVIYYFVETGEIVITNFIAAPAAPERKQEIELFLVLETYIRRVPCEGAPIMRVRSSPRDTCIAVLSDDIAVTGKNNQWFV